MAVREDPAESLTRASFRLWQNHRLSTELPPLLEVREKWPSRITVLLILAGSALLWAGILAALFYLI